jgi:hypothetical protein
LSDEVNQHLGWFSRSPLVIGKVPGNRLHEWVGIGSFGNHDKARPVIPLKADRTVAIGKIAENFIVPNDEFGSGGKPETFDHTASELRIIQGIHFKHLKR